MEDLGRLLVSPLSLSPSLPTDGYVAQLRRNCCYIVSAVILKDNKVLMIQEAKLGCRGKWYLPAGRVDPGETLTLAVQREVQEEAGFLFNPTRVVGIEGSSPGWMRFNFYGEISGGELKTHEDKESIQAKWFDLTEVLDRRIDLRAADIIPVIRNAVVQQEKLFVGTLPSAIERANYTVSLAIVFNDNSGSPISVVTDRSGGLPTMSIEKRDPKSHAKHIFDIFGIADKICKEIVGVGSTSDLLFRGILTLAYDGRQGKDGIHFTLLYASSTQREISSDCSWQSSNSSDIRTLLSSDRIIPVK
ncbi:putative nudix hydrolase 1 [Bolinopsis microptera]|uniref:putative nudix hydrolase 1 n=1 Tax=Bolinopsis microptera TaxID=2820187 RepID=UPI00307AF528